MNPRATSCAALARIAAAAVALAGAACATNPAPVPVVAEAGDLRALGGRWEGEYSSTETGRSGSIVFTLAAGRDTAHGDVVMVPRAFGVGRDPDVRPSAVDIRQPPPRPQVLTIRFVQLSGGEVSGTLEPYRDPECGCTLYTVFRGRLARDRIEGTFTSRHGHTSITSTGRWGVRRRSGNMDWSTERELTPGK